MGGKTADRDATVSKLDGIEAAHGTQADETARTDEPLLHHNDQRGAAGDKLGVAAELL